MDLAAILTGVAAILTAAGGCALVIREFRRRDRTDCQQDIDQLSEDLHVVRSDFAAFRRWAFFLREQAIDAGLDISEPPPPHPLAPADETVRLGGRVVRRIRRAHHGDRGPGDGPADQ